MKFISKLKNKLKYNSGWEHIGEDRYDSKGNLKLKYYVHDDILFTLGQKARASGGQKTVYSKGRTFQYKAEPRGDWFDNHGHGNCYLEIYRKLRR